MKPCALTEKEGGSPKEIWGITKEKEMLDGQKNPKYACQWTIKKMMPELNFKVGNAQLSRKDSRGTMRGHS